MVQYKDLLEQILFGNTLREWLVAAGIFVVVFVALSAFKRIVVKRLRAAAEKTATRLDDACVDVLESISMFVCVSVALFAATRSLLLPAIIAGIVFALFIIAIVYEAIQILQKLILFLLRRVWLKESADQEQVKNVLGLIIKIILWIVGAVLILSNLGFNVTSLIASLGIGGVAVALAAQNILGDVFSSFSIYFDRPFQVGDFIIVGDHMGTVKRVGLKTTRIEALQGEEIVISNAELTSTRVRNFKRMEKRRIAFAFGVTYGTLPAKLRKIPAIVRDIIGGIALAEFDRAHFKSFGDSSLDYEVVYYLRSSDYDVYMDAQQAINLGLVERFGEEGIAFAFPTRTVHVAAPGTELRSGAPVEGQLGT